MPPMPGSIARGPFLRELQRVATDVPVDGLKQISKALFDGAKLTDVLKSVPGSTLERKDIFHLERHWFNENGGDTNRWWSSEPTADIMRNGLVTFIELVTRAKAAGKKTYADCFWICRGDTVEVVNSIAEPDANTVHVNFTILTPPIPTPQLIADSLKQYTKSDDIYLTSKREQLTYDEGFLPGFVEVTDINLPKNASVTVDCQTTGKGATNAEPSQSIWRAQKA